MKEKNFIDYCSLVCSISCLVVMIFIVITLNRIREPTKVKPTQFFIGVKIDNDNTNNTINNTIQENKKNTTELQIIEFDTNKNKIIKKY